MNMTFRILKYSAVLNGQHISELWNIMILWRSLDIEVTLFSCLCIATWTRILGVEAKLHEVLTTALGGGE
jgi:hypothetical protein